jgi:heterodisulfide reductase subunit A
VPKIPVIDREHCLHFTLGRCGACELSCEPQAIKYDQEDTLIDLEADAIVVATGFDPFDPTQMPEYGYGQYPQVMTGLEFERLVSASGPTSGKIKLNGREPEEVVFIQCVGSRDEQHGHSYCSRVCCMYTAKQAHLVCEKLPEAQVTIFYMDIRAFGKGFEEFYDRVRRDGVIYRRGNPSEIIRHGDKLVVRAEDTLLGEPVEVEADLVVLAVGMEPRADAEQVAELLGLSLSGDGFLQEAHPKLRPVDTGIEGILLAGCCQGPKDIPDTVAQAKAAAAAAMIRMAKG